MPAQAPVRPKPDRWDNPFGENPTDELIDRLLAVEPFCRIDPDAFPRSTPLRSVLKNDTRFVRVDAGQFVYREGDYGGSAFMVLDGRLRVALDRLGPEATGRGAPAPGGLQRLVARLAGAWRARTPRPQHNDGVFVHDIPAVLDRIGAAELGPGELFGELAALTRAPRSASVFAEQPAVLLEIRWQGLRDLMRFSPAVAEHLHRLYRVNNLVDHLHSTPLFSRLTDEALARVAEAIRFEAFGSFDRHEPPAEDPLARARQEPVIVRQGQPVDSVLMIRNGFARLTAAYGEGDRTIAYLARGRTAGAEEAFVAHELGESPRWRRSLRAVGYVDLLSLPIEVFLREVAPTLPQEQTERWRRRTDEPLEPSVDRDASGRLDFLVDQRLVAATEAMVIDLDRCTRCDDCVRACAATHDGTPRFTRQGPIHEHLQYTEACLHCVDPVCMIGCPTGAIHRDEATGAVRVNDATCVGCTICANQCPYNAIRMEPIRAAGGAIVLDPETNEPRLRASKCDLCVGLATGPACQHACARDALVRIDLTESTPLNAWING